MKKKVSILTPNEQLLMELFWNIGKPMTSIDLCDYLPDDCQDWKNGYLHNLLKILLDKKMLRVTNILQYGRRFAKQYEPALTKEEYAAKMVSSLNFESDSVSKIAYAIAKEVSGENSDRIISELEDILDKLKKDNCQI